jgi:hypothetical protein
VSSSIDTTRAPSRHLDLAGGWASIICAVHCALLPLALAIVPGTGLDVLDNHAFDAYFAAFVILFGTVVIGTGYCPHRIRLVLAAFVAATIALLFGALDGDHGWRHAALLSLGGALMASAHLINRDGIRHHHCLRNPFRDRSAA